MIIIHDQYNDIAYVRMHNDFSMKCPLESSSHALKHERVQTFSTDSNRETLEIKTDKRSMT